MLTETKKLCLDDVTKNFTLPSLMEIQIGEQLEEPTEKEEEINVSNRMCMNNNLVYYKEKHKPGAHCKNIQWRRIFLENNFISN